MDHLLKFLLPEMGLTVLLFSLLFVRIAGRLEKTGQIGFLMNFAYPLLGLLMVFNGPVEGSLFGNMLHVTSLIHYEKLILLLAVWLISLQSEPWLSGHKHPAEFHMLVISVLMGMFFLLSSGNLLIFYLALELSSIPLATLCNFDLDKRVSGEAAMKMILSSAFSSAILLFGISLFYGATGTLSLSELSASLDGSPLQLTAFLLVLTGFAFKLSVVPFHFWTAEVYEGSPVPVTAFLSVVSKGVMAFAFVSVLYTVFSPLEDVWYAAITFLAVLTMTFGNLFAIRQQNIKRLLAFSSIAQMGYVLIGISGTSQQGMASVIFFMLVYLFSNIAAFGVVTLVVTASSRESIDELKGFRSTNPGLAWILALAFFSLAGIPPTAGFFGKFFLLTAGAARWNTPVLVIAALNMVVSLYYYLRVIRAMFMDAPVETPIHSISAPFAVRISLFICIVGMLTLGFYSPAYEWIRSISFGF
ncbi:MAG: NADH-quinone oxidoreductase subunit N [Bacteroidota bacterium]